MERILMTVRIAPCSLDLCPFWLASATLGVIWRWVGVAVNVFLWERVDPLPLKKALAWPLLLKKPFLDPTILDNFQPVFNIPFFSSFNEYWRKRIIWTPFSQDSGLNMEQKQHCSYFWMISGGSRMRIVQPFWFLTSWQLSIALTMVDWLCGLGVGGTVFTGSLTSYGANTSQCWSRVRGPTLGPYYVWYHKV